METIPIFSGLNPNDAWFLLQAAWRTLLIAIFSVSVGTLIGVFLGWCLHESNRYVSIAIAWFLDIFRSVPLIIQLILINSFVAIMGFPLSPFWSGSLVLAIYTASLVAFVAKGGIAAVEPSLRRAARSLGLSYWQDMRYVVFPVGLRAVFPSWVGIALSVLKDSALVSVLGYVELLRASQILITRTQEPFLILGIVGLFYFALSYPISWATARVERKWQS